MVAAISSTDSARDRTLWRLAVPPLIALLGAGMSGSLLREVTGQLAGLDRAVAGRDEPGRDRPARQRLDYVTEQATAWARRAGLDLDRSPLADAARSLAADASCTRQAAGLLAVALVSYGVKLSWPAPWRALVRSLRDHPVSDVRAAALEIVMAPE